MNAPAIPEPVRAEAERWFGLMLTPECPPPQLAAFQHWLQAAPEHRQAYLQVERLWEQLGEAVLRPGVRALPEAASPTRVARPAPDVARLEFRPRPRAQPTRQKWNWVGALAACMVLAIGGMFLYGQRPQPLVYATAVGETRSVTLDDGSMVTLDTDSRIAVAYDGRGRRVDLQRGMAFFDVTPQSARPFTVATAHGSVTVLGTQFQVREDGDGTQVVLVKGAVRLDAADAGGAGPQVLRPGQQARRHAGGAWQVAVADADGTAWRQGRLVFRATPLSQAVAEVNRYTMHKLRIADSSLERLAVSGVFRTGDPDSFVLVLENSLPVHARTDRGERVLSRAD